MSAEMNRPNRIPTGVRMNIYRTIVVGGHGPASTQAGAQIPTTATPTIMVSLSAEPGSLGKFQPPGSRCNSIKPRRGFGLRGPASGRAGGTDGGRGVRETSGAGQPGLFHEEYAPGQAAESVLRELRWFARRPAQSLYDQLFLRCLSDCGQLGRGLIYGFASRRGAANTMFVVWAGGWVCFTMLREP